MRKLQVDSASRATALMWTEETGEDRTSVTRGDVVEQFDVVSRKPAIVIRTMLRFNITHGDLLAEFLPVGTDVVVTNFPKACVLQLEGSLLVQTTEAKLKQVDKLDASTEGGKRDNIAAYVIEGLVESRHIACFTVKAEM
ncbi:uncharacterized protein MYCGRDRAFT_96648 [Zymoseptoria tritici IPO323]|uniref:Uncharacterized protein n=1 Tax=Zymoseptoria tritici (strain CBS 115943 / IPO323) TaxID=336722 RepID=F9XN23_ZYMTI|nr:uncharacterized protein MYCGRDRAFT_96648 [Zymoseptoria tritici IPO323]EGP83338.1 hypothetical protein MYCGRDRAFT_96648 [Zymoseptoria tritici IPO323]